MIHSVPCLHASTLSSRPRQSSAQNAMERFAAAPPVGLRRVQRIRANPGHFISSALPLLSCWTRRDSLFAFISRSMKIEIKTPHRGQLQHITAAIPYAAPLPDAFTPDPALFHCGRMVFLLYGDIIAQSTTKVYFLQHSAQSFCVSSFA